MKKWAPAPFPIVAPTVSPVPTAKVEESEPEALERLLARLVRVGSLYRNFALEFECRESVTYTIFGKETRGKRFAYLFVNEGEQGSPREYRLTRRQVNKETTLEEANPRDFGIDLFLENAYLFTEVFGEPRQPFYRFSLDGAEEVLGRQAMRLFVEPRPPMRSRLNDWVGWFWIDSETSQILRVEAYHAESAVAWTDLQADLVRAKESEAEFYREHVTEKVTVEFGVERNGMRFPSRAEILKERYGVRGGRVARNEKGRKVARTTQHYEDYRFFAIKTVEEIRAYVEAGSE